MTDKYTGQTMDRRYQGDHADILYSLKRCIHAEQCIHHLAQVFNKDARPWINASNATGDEIAAVVGLCPSGALHFERKDGGSGETTPAENVITLWHNGPLQFSGNLSITGATVAVEGETRATLCRCGASKNKPFCDNAHHDFDFQAADPVGINVAPFDERGGALTIAPGTNGPLHVKGNLQIRNTQGEVIFAGQETWLCRCGQSQNKPFCDGTHNKIGFQAE